MMECWGKIFNGKVAQEVNLVPISTICPSVRSIIPIFTSLSLHHPTSLLPHLPISFSPYLLSGGEEVSILHSDLAHSSISLRVVSFCCRIQKSA
jgi:hypothetical protein